NQTNQTRSVRIVSNLEEPLSIEPPVLANASFQTELKTVRPGKEFELLITAVPPFTTPYASIPIKLKTSAKEMPEISTTAFVSVAQPISISPSQVILPTGPLAS